MKEDVFVRQNKSKWKHYEIRLESMSMVSISELSDIYLDLIADLAYAQSQYPNSRIIHYLNNLSRITHEYLYKNKKRSFKKIIDFFAYDIPHVVADAHKEIKLSFILFMTFVVAGIILACQDIDNVRATLGDSYVDMTLENITNGHPTDVYGQGDEKWGFLSIVLNNLRVDIITYIWGIIPILGPLYILFSNGIMLGEFQSFFFLNGVGFESMTAIWIHGTIEISTIIICGGAALALGNGWIFPHNYSRRYAFKKSAARSVKIFMSIVPLTILAAFLEGFATRHTEWPLIIKLGIIGLSLAFIIFYYIYLPHKIRHKL